MFLNGQWKCMEQIKEFLKALKTDPRVKEMLGGTEPESKEETLQLYAKAAGILGFSLTAEQIEEGINKLTEEMMEKTASAESSVKELDLDDLAQVSGGGGTECVKTYNPNENCDFEDRCNSVFRSYFNEKCKATWNCSWVVM